MSELQELQGQLSELGFVLLEDTHTNASAVLQVEVWVRYTPYALIPIPIRGEEESDESYNSRIAIANESIADIFEQDAAEATLLQQVDVPEPEYVEPQPEYSYDEPEQEPEQEYAPVDAGDYYAYVPPVVAQPEPEYVEPVEEPTLEENVGLSEPVEYDDADRAKLVIIRASLISALEEIDSLLNK